MVQPYKGNIIHGRIQISRAIGVDPITFGASIGRLIDREFLFRDDKGTLCLKKDNLALLVHEFRKEVSKTPILESRKIRIAYDPKLYVGLVTICCDLGAFYSLSISKPRQFAYNILKKRFSDLVTPAPENKIELVVKKDNIKTLVERLATERTREFPLDDAQTLIEGISSYYNLEVIPQEQSIKERYIRIDPILNRLGLRRGQKALYLAHYYIVSCMQTKIKIANGVFPITSIENEEELYRVISEYTKRIIRSPSNKNQDKKVTSVEEIKLFSNVYDGIIGIIQRNPTCTNSANSFTQFLQREYGGLVNFNQARTFFPYAQRVSSILRAKEGSEQASALAALKAEYQTK